MNFEIWARFLLGCLVGAGVVWSSVERTLAVHNSDYRAALTGSIVNSLAYYWSIHFVAKDDLVSYWGTAVGSTLIILIVIWHKRRGATK